MNCTEDLGYQQIQEYIKAFSVSKTMFTACELGVFDLLHGISEPLSAANIASRLSTNVDGTDRLLSACVGLKLLKTEMKNGEAYYSNTDLSTTYLVKSSAKSLYHMIMFNSYTVYMCWHFLPQAIREGRNQYERAFGIPSNEMFDVVYRTEEEMVTFMQCMHSTWNTCGKNVLKAFDLSMFHSIYDIGGCSGALAKQFISVYPGSTVTVMDLPKVVQIATKHFITEKNEPISFLEGDFFNDQIPEADLYILARIIHDWTEEKCLQILRKIYQSCRSGGGVLLVEFHLNEDKSGPLLSLLGSLNMLVLTDGKERTSSEYSKLLTDSGFKDIQVKPTGGIYDAILGRK